MIYWFTGQPSHGKTTLATLLVKYLEKIGKKVFHIDGDDLRDITLNKDYSKEGRINNVKSAQQIAHYLHNEGYDVVVSLVSPYREQRESFKKHVGNFVVELYVHTTEPRERDLLKSKDYEPPLYNFIDVDTTDILPKESLEEIIWWIEKGI